MQTTRQGHLSDACVPDEWAVPRIEVDMEATGIAEEIASLPPEAQRQVMDFVAFLKTRYRARRTAREPRPARLADEPFIGMWRERADMGDSTAWVRDVRRREWDPDQ